MPSLAVDRAAFEAELDRLRRRGEGARRRGCVIAAARRRLPMVEVDPRHPPDRAAGVGYPARRIRGAQAAHRLLLHAVARPPGGGAVRRLHLGQRPGRRVVLPARARHHLRGRSARAPTTRASATTTSWAGTCPGTRRRPPLDTLLAGRQVGRIAPRVLPPGRRPRLRDLLDDQPRRRGHGLQLRAHGPHRVRTPGAVGGLARRLATPMASRRLQ